MIFRGLVSLIFKLFVFIESVKFRDRLDIKIDKFQFNLFVICNDVVVFFVIRFFFLDIRYKFEKKLKRKLIVEEKKVFIRLS